MFELPALAGDGGDVDDLAALALGVDVADRRLGAEERAAHLHVHHALEECGVQVRYRRSILAAGDGGVVDQDVDAAELADDLFDGRVGLLLVGDIESQRESTSSLGLDLLHDAVDVLPAHGLLVVRERRRIAPGAADRDIGAETRERHCRSATDAAQTACTGHQRDLAFEFSCSGRVCH